MNQIFYWLTLTQILFSIEASYANMNLHNSQNSKIVASEDCVVEGFPL